MMTNLENIIVSNVSHTDKDIIMACIVDAVMDAIEAFGTDSSSISDEQILEFANEAYNRSANSGFEYALSHAINVVIEHFDVEYYGNIENQRKYDIVLERIRQNGNNIFNTYFNLEGGNMIWS